MTRTPTVTVGFTPRERFSMSATALEQLFRNTAVPFNLIVVDCNTPGRYRQEIDAVLANRPNVRVIRAGKHLLPNQSKNRVVQASRDDYVLLIENDCLVFPGCLDRLLAACEEFPADVAVPLLLEGPRWFRVVHHDDHLGRIETRETSDGRTVIRFARSGLGNLQRRLQRERCAMELFENHCLLFRRSVFDKIGLLDERLNTDEYIDLALALRQAGLKTVFEPGARVHFNSPPPVNADEEEFYRFRWDVRVAVNGNRAIREKWNIENMSRTDLFTWSQQFRTSRGRWIAHRISLLFGAYRRVKLPEPDAPAK